MSSQWTKEDTELLRSYRTIIDSDDIKIKERIKKEILSNKYIIHVLSPNTPLDEADELFGTHILPYYAIEPTQTEVDNYLCYEVTYDELYRYDSTKTRKDLNIIFYVLSHVRNIIDKDTYVAKHDLLAALILDQFDHTNLFGEKIRCVQDKAGVLDTHYVLRTLIFEQITTNNLVKTIDKVPRLVNKNKELYGKTAQA